MADRANPANQPAQGHFEPTIYELHDVEVAPPKGEVFGAHFPELRIMPASEEENARGRRAKPEPIMRTRANDLETPRSKDVKTWPRKMQLAMEGYRVAAHAGVIAVSRFTVWDGNWVGCTFHQKKKAIDTWEAEQEAARLDELVSHEYVVL